MKRRTLYTCFLLLGTVAVYGGWLAWRAHKDLVTLHVRSEPVDKVLRSMRWQTWEHFELHKDVSGTVSIDVDRMPLENVLEIISEQVSARWTAVYPIYQKSDALTSLERALNGSTEFAQSRFTNWQSRAFGMRGGPGGRGPGGFGEPSTNETKLVSMQLSNNPPAIASLALNRFGRQAQVVPENSLNKPLNLTISDLPFEKAVARVAKAANSSWTKWYALQPGGRGGEQMFAAGAPAQGERGERPRGEMPPEARARMQQVMETMPPEQRQQAQERREMMQAMQSLPAEQRSQLMQERMNSPEAQQQMQQRSTASVKNSTPEQRRDRYERMYSMRKAREAGLAPANSGRGPRQ